jgi:hypothetical protein
MHLPRLLAAAAGAALLLTACAGPLVTRGVHTRADARFRFGPPTDVHVDDQGREVWEYATGRLGRGTSMVTFGKDGDVAEVRSALRSDNFAKVLPQQSTWADVRALLGMPGEIEIFPRTDAEVWTYRVLDEAMRRMLLKIEFDRAGIVRGVSRLIEGEGGAPGGGARN